MKKLTNEINLQEALNLQSNKALILDTRDSIENGYIKSSLNIPLSGSFAINAGTFINPTKKIIIYAENQIKTKESIERLLRIGYENIIGYFCDPIENIPFENIEKHQKISVEDLQELTNCCIIDLRNKSCY